MICLLVSNLPTSRQTLLVAGSSHGASLCWVLSLLNQQNKYEYQILPPTNQSFKHPLFYFSRKDNSLSDSGLYSKNMIYLEHSYHVALCGEYCLPKNVKYVVSILPMAIVAIKRFKLSKSIIYSKNCFRVFNLIFVSEHIDIKLW